MRLVTIFDDRIWSVVYDDSIEDAFNDEFNLWHDAEYIYKFFFDNNVLKDNSIWKQFSIEDLTLKVLDEANMFESRLKDMYKKGFMDFDNEFVNLSKQTTDMYLIESKAYGKPLEFKPSLLRLYAIRIEKDKYVITGGGIKIVHEMKESKELLKELDKLKRVKEWLKSNGIHISYDVESLTE